MGKRGNGEGTIYYSEAKKRWVGQYVAYRTASGKLKRKTVYGKTRKEVKDKINDALVAIRKNNYIEKSNTTMIELLQENAENKLESNQINENSYNRILYTIDIIEDNMYIAQMAIQDITVADINKSLSKITRYSQSVINKIVARLSIAYDLAIINNIVSSNPFRIRGAIIRPKSLKEAKKVEALTVDEEKAFIKELKKRL